VLAASAGDVVAATVLLHHSPALRTHTRPSTLLVLLECLLVLLEVRVLGGLGLLTGLAVVHLAPTQQTQLAAFGTREPRAQRASVVADQRTIATVRPTTDFGALHLLDHVCVVLLHVLLVYEHLQVRCTQLRAALLLTPLCRPYQCWTVEGHLPLAELMLDVVAKTLEVVHALTVQQTQAPASP